MSISSQQNYIPLRLQTLKNKIEQGHVHAAATREEYMTYQGDAPPLGKECASYKDSCSGDRVTQIPYFLLFIYP
jgi:hypothetical protein